MLVIGLGSKREGELECPFCGKGKIKTFHKEGHLQAHTSRISAGAKTKYSRIDDLYKVLEDCPTCGKKKKEIQDVIDGKKSVKCYTHEEKIAMLKKRGLPLVISSSK